MRRYGRNLLSALALQAAWTYHSADMPCAAFTPVSTHVFASTPTAEFRIIMVPRQSIAALFTAEIKRSITG